MGIYDTTSRVNIEVEQVAIIPNQSLGCYTLTNFLYSYSDNTVLRRVQKGLERLHDVFASCAKGL